LGAAGDNDRIYAFDNNRSKISQNKANYGPKIRVNLDRNGANYDLEWAWVIKQDQKRSGMRHQTRPIKAKKIGQIKSQKIGYMAQE
jgi:hypothetical protein